MPSGPWFPPDSSNVAFGRERPFCTVGHWFDCHPHRSGRKYHVFLGWNLGAANTVKTAGAQNRTLGDTLWERSRVGLRVTKAHTKSTICQIGSKTLKSTPTNAQPGSLNNRILHSWNRFSTTRRQGGFSARVLYATVLMGIYLHHGQTWLHLSCSLYCHEITHFAAPVRSFPASKQPYRNSASQF